LYCNQKINIMSKLSREDMVILLNAKFPMLNCLKTEDFYSNKSDDYSGGIWLCGEDDTVVDKSGTRIFHYYNNSSKYIFGVLVTLNTLLEKNGWRAEWYDAGTIMFWEN
jgi:hypothetical protein